MSIFYQVSCIVTTIAALAIFFARPFIIPLLLRFNKKVVYNWSYVILIFPTLACVIASFVVFLHSERKDFDGCCKMENQKFNNDMLETIQQSTNKLTESSDRLLENLQTNVQTELKTSDDNFMGSLITEIDSQNLELKGDFFYPRVTELSLKAGPFEKDMKTLKSSVQPDTSCHTKMTDYDSIFKLQEITQKMKQSMGPIKTIIHDIKGQLDSMKVTWVSQNVDHTKKFTISRKIVTNNMGSLKKLIAQFSTRVQESVLILPVTFNPVDILIILFFIVCGVVAICSSVPFIDHILSIIFGQVKVFPQFLRIAAFIITILAVVGLSVFLAILLFIESFKPNEKCPLTAKNDLLKSFTIGFEDNDGVLNKDYAFACKTLNDTLFAQLDIERLFSTDSILKIIDLEEYKLHMIFLIKYGGLIRVDFSDDFQSGSTQIGQVIDALGTLAEQTCFDDAQKTVINDHKKYFDKYVEESKPFLDMVKGFNSKFDDPEQWSGRVFKPYEDVILAEVEKTSKLITDKIFSGNLGCEHIFESNSKCVQSLDNETISVLICGLLGGSILSIFYQALPSPWREYKKKVKKPKQQDTKKVEDEKKSEEESEEPEFIAFDHNYILGMNSEEIKVVKQQIADRITELEAQKENSVEPGAQEN